MISGTESQAWVSCLGHNTGLNLLQLSLNERSTQDIQQMINTFRKPAGVNDIKVTCSR